MIEHVVRLSGLAAIDSVNLLAFAVLAGLWVGAKGVESEFLPKAVRFTGGAFFGITGLAGAMVWILGANRAAVRGLLSEVWVMALIAVVGLGLVAMGLKRPAETKAENVDVPLTRGTLQRFGILTTGFVLGIIQSATSAPFLTAMVDISFTVPAVWQQAVEIGCFGAVAVTPSVVLITVLSRVPQRRVAAASARIDVFMAWGRIAGRVLTVAIGVALFAGALWRIGVLEHL